MSTRSSPHYPHPPTRKVVNIVALLLVLCVNALANLLPLNGVTTGQVSAEFPNLFTPADYTFGIWGLIYVALVAFVLYQALPAQRENPRLGRLGYLFAWSCFFNIAWLFAWHYLLIGLSQLLMLGLLLTLIACYWRLGVDGWEPRGLEQWTVDLPFSIYLGWITVATLANTAVFLVSLGLDGGRFAPAWTVGALAVATLVGVLALRLRVDLVFAAVLAWAFVGIAVKQWGLTPLVVVAALTAVALLAASAVRQALLPRAT